MNAVRSQGKWLRTPNTNKLHPIDQMEEEKKTTICFVFPLGISVDAHTIIMVTFQYSGFTTEVPLEGFVALMLQLESNSKWCNVSRDGEQHSISSSSIWWLTVAYEMLS